MNAYTLYEMNEHLRRVVALNFSDALWVRCEMAQVNESRGHFYLNLVQKEEKIIAKANAILWARNFRKLQREHGRGVIKILQEGLEVLLKLKVAFHEVYGMQFYVEDIDTDYTLGKLATKKLQIIERLERENLLGKNGSVPLPFVLQRIAVISSVKAAGYQDYLSQLSNNGFGYVFDNQLFTAAMQGESVEEEILFQLKKIRVQKDKFDAVVIIRGGGAKLDLLAFDNEKISRKVADFPLPVLTGIGHYIDESILDKVAHTALKTPTAVADFILNHNLIFENKLLQLGSEVQYAVQEKLQAQYFLLQNLEQSLEWQVTSFVEKQQQHLHYLKELFEVLSPEKTLQRGFTITSVNGKIVKSVAAFDSQKSVEITTQFVDGIIKSKTKA
ncbi:MAG: exodeoxyribonuclease VII large subunit [Bacteroidota bacterium]